MRDVGRPGPRLPFTRKPVLSAPGEGGLRVDLADGLIWGFGLTGERARPLASAVGDGFRWLHFNLADMRAQRWISAAAMPQLVRDLLLTRDASPSALVEDGWVAFALQDAAREFNNDETTELGVILCAIGPDLVVTARHHPVRCADAVRRRIEGGAAVRGPAGALDLLLSSLTGFVAAGAGELTRHVQRIEDALLDEGRTPDQRALIAARRRAVQLHRQLDGLRNVITRLEQDEDLPEAVRPAVERLAQRIVGLDGEVTAIERQTRSLRDELDLQAMQRTNQNLVILSVLTALMLPSTLVTGIFGMNTGGLPFARSPYGTLAATLLAVAAAFGVFLFLRLMGFFGGRR